MNPFGLIRNPRHRAWAIQVPLGLVLLGLAGFLAANTAANLAERNIPFGLDFFGNIAGFDIPFTLIDWSTSDSYARAILVGLLNTGLVVSLGIVVSTVLGFSVGVMRLSPNWLARSAAGALVEFVRNTPALLQVVFCYLALIQSLPGPRESLVIGDAIYLNVRGLFLPTPIIGHSAHVLVWILPVLIFGVWGTRRLVDRREPRYRSAATFAAAAVLLLAVPAAWVLLTGANQGWSYPQLKGLRFSGGLVLSPELVALVTGLSLYSTAFIAEVVRAGILSVTQGQTEAALSLGLRRGHVLRLVTIPQALRVIVPPLTNQYLNLAKGSSLAVAIAYPDLVQILIGSILNRTGQAIEIMTLTMLVYLSLSLAISLLMNWYNRRKALPGH